MYRGIPAHKAASVTTCDDSDDRPRSFHRPGGEPVLATPKVREKWREDLEKKMNLNGQGRQKIRKGEIPRGK